MEKNVDCWNLLQCFQRYDATVGSDFEQLHTAYSVGSGLVVTIITNVKLSGFWPQPSKYGKH